MLMWRLLKIFEFISSNLQTFDNLSFIAIFQTIYQLGVGEII